MSPGTSNAAIEQHIRRFFNGHQITAQQFHNGPAVHDLPNLSVLEIGPGPRSAGWTYVTCGAWEATSASLLEYLMTADQARSRYVELLTIIAYYTISATFGVGHTVSIGEPLLDGSLCEDVYLSLPYTFGPDLERFTADGREGRILWAFPLTPTEKRYLLDNGVQALEDRLEASKVEYWSPFRASVV